MKGVAKVETTLRVNWSRFWLAGSNPNLGLVPPGFAPTNPPLERTFF